MKQRSFVPSLLVAILIGSSVQADTLDYTVDGWQVNCATSYYTGIQGNCLYNGTKRGSLAKGTITGQGQFVGACESGGTLSTDHYVYVTSSTPGVGPATLHSIAWFALAPGGAVTTGGGGLVGCTPATDVICQEPPTTPASLGEPADGLWPYDSECKPLPVVGPFTRQYLDSWGGALWRSWTLTLLPCDDADADGVCDDVDTCPGIANAANNTDTNGDGIGDFCQCGDVNGDGTMNNIDSILIKRADLGLSTGASYDPALCDVNADGLCNNLDSILIKRADLGLSTGSAFRTMCGPMP